MSNGGDGALRVRVLATREVLGLSARKRPTSVYNAALLAALVEEMPPAALRRLIRTGGARHPERSERPTVLSSDGILVDGRLRSDLHSDARRSVELFWLVVTGDDRAEAAAAAFRTALTAPAGDPVYFGAAGSNAARMMPHILTTQTAVHSRLLGSLALHAHRTGRGDLAVELTAAVLDIRSAPLLRRAPSGSKDVRETTGPARRCPADDAADILGLVPRNRKRPARITERQWAMTEAEADAISLSTAAAMEGFRSGWLGEAPDVALTAGPLESAAEGPRRFGAALAALRRDATGTPRAELVGAVTKAAGHPSVRRDLAPLLLRHGIGPSRPTEHAVMRFLGLGSELLPTDLGIGPDWMPLDP